jgi:hypothetical protein
VQSLSLCHAWKPENVLLALLRMNVLLSTQAVDEAAEAAAEAADNRTRISRFMPTSRRIVQVCRFLTCKYCTATLE